MSFKLFLTGYESGASQLGIQGYLIDSNGTYTGSYQTTIAPSASDTAGTIQAAAETAFVAYLVANGLAAPSSVEWIVNTDADPLSFANPTRSLNSAFQISSSRTAQVSYAVNVSCALSLTTGQSGTVFLEYADDSGFTTNVVTVNSFVNGNTGTLAIGLALTQVATGVLAGMIPAGKYVRLRTANTTGTPTFTFVSAQEVLV